MWRCPKAVDGDSAINGSNGFFGKESKLIISSDPRQVSVVVPVPAPRSRYDVIGKVMGISLASRSAVARKLELNKSQW